MNTSLFKKKIVLFIVLITFLIVYASGCNKSKQIEDIPDLQLEDIPDLQLEYIKDDKTEMMNVNHGTISWNFKTSGIESDAPHPLDAIGSIPEIIKTEDLSEIKIYFSSQPTSYTVRCWTEEYIDNNKAYDNYYDDVEVTDDIIALPKDNMGYIYMIHAKWPQGNAYYGFYVVNSDLTDNNTIPDYITTPILVKDILIGGLSNGMWMRIDDFYNSGAVDFEGFEYDLYSNNVKTGTAIGGQLTNWITGEKLLGEEYDYGYSIVEFYNDDNQVIDYDIAIKADWNLYPRSYSEDSKEEDNYTNIVKDYLIESGIEEPNTTVKQIVNVDLEGDGTDEILIVADNKNDDSFDEVKIGDNALLIFRKYVDGKAVDQILEQHIIIDEPEYPSPYRLLYGVDTIADLDGDGIMEIIVQSSYYEGFGWTIYKLIDNRLEIVASNGVGA